MSSKPGFPIASMIAAAVALSGIVAAQAPPTPAPYGDAFCFQQRGARVVASAADWELIGTPTGPVRGGGRAARLNVAIYAAGGP